MSQPGDNKTSDFKSASQPNIVSFSLQGLTPPTPLYIQRDDVLVVRGMSQTANEVITVNGRLLTVDKVVVPFEFTLPLGAALSLNTQEFPLSEGFLLSIAVTSTVAVSRGQTFARLWLQRGLMAQPNNAAYELLADYVTQFGCQGWPGGRIIDPTEGSGYLQNISVAQPAAGSEWLWAVPANTRVKIISAMALLTTSATVANRAARGWVQVAGALTWRGPSPGIHAASTLFNYDFAPISPYFDTNGGAAGITIPPGLILDNSAGSSNLQSSTLNLQAGDQWSGIQICVESWLMNV